MAKPGKIDANDRTLSREERLDVGRAHFDANGWTEKAMSPWRPGNREEYARAYADISRPFGGR